MVNVLIYMHNTTSNNKLMGTKILFFMPKNLFLSGKAIIFIVMSLFNVTIGGCFETTRFKRLSVWG